MGTEFQKPEEKTDPDPIVISSFDVTRRHDVGEWMQGFQSGVPAGRKDVMDALRTVLGEGPFSSFVQAEILKLLSPGSEGGLTPPADPDHHRTR